MGLKRLLQIIVILCLLFWVLINWVWKMDLSSDIPVQILLEDIIPWMISMLLVTMLYLIFVKSKRLNWVILLPLGLWGISFCSALIYQYHPYVTLRDGVGFFATLLCFSYVWRIKNRKQSFSSLC